MSVLAVAESGIGDGASSRSRGALRAIAEKTLPRSLVVWRGPAGRERAALTFDDGPDAMTPSYLDVLDRFSARATFFVVGRQCVRYPEVVGEIDAAGHELAVHGYTHRRFTELASVGLLRQELERTFELLPPGARRLARPPQGAVSIRSLLASARAGFTTVLWSLDSGDWLSRRADHVRARVTPERVGPGGIVLMHEGQVWTIDALGSILQRLTERGYELVTVGELLNGN